MGELMKEASPPLTLKTTTMPPIHDLTVEIVEETLTYFAEHKRQRNGRERDDLVIQYFRLHVRLMFAMFDA